MVDTNILDITLLATNQTDRTTTVNDALQAIETATQSLLAVDMTAGNVSLTEAQFTRNFYFECDGHGASVRDLTVPLTINAVASNRFYMVTNLDAGTVTVQGTTGATVDVLTDEIVLLYNNGTDQFLVAKSSGGGGGGTSDAKVLEPCRCASDVNVPLTTGLENGDTIDGITLATGDRVLLTGQSAGAENGVYVVVASGTASRSTDFDEDAEAIAGMMIPVIAGEQFAHSIWMMDTEAAITIDTTAMTFVQNGGIIYDFGFAFSGGPPATDEVLGVLVVPRDITLPADFVGAAGDIGTNPTATFDILVTDDGSTIGTISISTGGAFTFTTVSNTLKNVAAGSVLRFVAPTVTDATADDIVATLQARLT